MRIVRAMFMEGAARLAGIAAVLLGWRPGEFWAATPDELAGVLGALNGEGAGAGAMDRAGLEQMMAAERERQNG